MLTPRRRRRPCWYGAEPTALPPGQNCIHCRFCSISYLGWSDGGGLNVLSAADSHRDILLACCATPVVSGCCLLLLYMCCLLPACFLRPVACLASAVGCPFLMQRRTTAGRGCALRRRDTWLSGAPPLLLLQLLPTDRQLGRTSAFLTIAAETADFKNQRSGWTRSVWPTWQEAWIAVTQHPAVLPNAW